MDSNLIRGKGTLPSLAFSAHSIFISDSAYLRSYLYRFGIKNSSYCQCGYGKETEEYYLMECRNYREQRKKLKREVGAGKVQYYWKIQSCEI